MTYSDILSLAVSAFGLGLAAGLMWGAVFRFMRSFGHN